ncbi:hypothetical protein MAM1_0376c10158 [Mucor ambiguus]|uniref:Nucleoplasmin-like domain-containing protein n=1 Tax=Mucor ambiguus TaxID=91626 RepID=A0A0C9MT50_9FUNG|nr:hypothetical protein MAM1_0376c10158 [Mucor ambiguus]
MSVKFWGRTLNPGESFPMQTAGILEIRLASLPETPEKGKTIVKIISKGHAFTLCTLDRNLVECQSLSHTFIAEDEATLVVQGVNPVHFIGSMIVDTDASSSEDEDDMDYTPTQINEDQDMDESEEDEERETITGQPRYANYLSDLLGPDLPDEDDDDYEDMDDDEADDFGTMAFRDPTDNEFLGGFELRHFNLAPNVPGYDVVDLRKQEKDAEDTRLQQVFMIDFYIHRMILTFLLLQ